MFFVALFPGRARCSWSAGSLRETRLEGNKLLSIDVFKLFWGGCLVYQASFYISFLLLLCYSLSRHLEKLKYAMYSSPFFFLRDQKGLLGRKEDWVEPVQGYV